MAHPFSSSPIGARSFSGLAKTMPQFFSLRLEPTYWAPVWLKNHGNQSSQSWERTRPNFQVVNTYQVYSSTCKVFCSFATPRYRNTPLSISTVHMNRLSGNPEFGNTFHIKVAHLVKKEYLPFLGASPNSGYWPRYGYSKISTISLQSELWFNVPDF